MGRIERYLEMAGEEAAKSPMGMKHGALLVKGGKVLAKGHNHYRSRLSRRNVCSTHAELQALAQQWKKKKKHKNLTKGMDLIVVRLAATSGDFAPSKPCRDCLQELKRAQVHRVTYTTGCRDVLCATEKVSCMNEEEAIVTSKRQEMELLRLRDLKKNKILGREERERAVWQKVNKK